MSRDCRAIRDHLTSTGTPPAGLANHLENCPACTRFAERAGIARRYFADHHAGVVPDASFAAAVAARLEQQRPEVELGLAAAKLIPATLALLIVLAWMAWRTETNPTSLIVESPSEAPLSWALDSTGGDS